MKLFKNILFIYVFTFILGVISYFLQKYGVLKIWDYFQVADTASAVALAILAGFAYYDYVKDENTIHLYFQVDDKKIDTKLSLLRKEFSRSEVLGILGMIQKDPKNRFNLDFFKNPEILKVIQAIQKGSGDEFVIKLNKKELDYFNI